MFCLKKKHVFFQKKKTSFEKKKLFFFKHYEYSFNAFSNSAMGNGALYRNL